MTKKRDADSDEIAELIKAYSLIKEPDLRAMILRTVKALAMAGGHRA